MSLCTDKFFKVALQSDESIMELTGGRIFNTVDDEIEPDSAPVPYIIICNDGTQNDELTKDCNYESDYDSDTVRLTVTARSREELATIATAARNAVVYAAGQQGDGMDMGFYIQDYSFSASSVNFDEVKPCYWQDLTYVCNVGNL